LGLVGWGVEQGQKKLNQSDYSPSTFLDAPKTEIESKKKFKIRPESKIKPKNVSKWPRQCPMCKTSGAKTFTRNTEGIIQCKECEYTFSS
jgi:hypothetical protein